MIWILLLLLNGLPIALSAPDNATDNEASTEPAPSKPKEVERALPNPSQASERALEAFLAQHQRSSELVQLEAAGEPFTGAFLQERTGKPQGAALILPDIGQHAQWPELVAPLREALPDYGWASLALSLPSPPRPDTASTESKENKPASTPSSAQKPADDTTPTEQTNDATQKEGNTGPKSAQEISAEPALPKLESLPPLPDAIANNAPQDSPKPNAAKQYQEQMLGRIEAGVKQLRGQGQHNLVLVASGENAVWAALWLLQKYPDKNAPKGVYLVLVDASEDAYAPEKINAILPKLGLPMLDIVTPFNQNHRFINKTREGAIKHSKNKDYLQVELAAVSLENNYGNAVARWIRGWLRVHAAGNEKTLEP